MKDWPSDYIKQKRMRITARNSLPARPTVITFFWRYNNKGRLNFWSLFERKQQQQNNTTCSSSGKMAASTLSSKMEMITSRWKWRDKISPDWKKNKKQRNVSTDALYLECVRASAESENNENDESRCTLVREQCSLEHFEWSLAWTPYFTPVGDRRSNSTADWFEKSGYIICLVVRRSSSSSSFGLTWVKTHTHTQQQQKNPSGYSIFWRPSGVLTGNQLPSAIEEETRHALSIGGLPLVLSTAAVTFSDDTARLTFVYRRWKTLLSSIIEQRVLRVTYVHVPVKNKCIPSTVPLHARIRVTEHRKPHDHDSTITFLPVIYYFRNKGKYWLIHKIPFDRNVNLRIRNLIFNNYNGHQSHRYHTIQMIV